VGRGQRVGEGDQRVGWRGWGASKADGAFDPSSEGLSAGDSPAVGFAGKDAGETEMGTPVCKYGVAGVEFRGAVRGWVGEVVHPFPPSSDRSI
jgi:hypothetical protein